MPETALVELRDQIRAAEAARQPLRIRGGGTKDFYGEPPTGQLLETARLAGIVSYEPTELVVTVRAGTLLSELQSALAEKSQMLAFEPPSFGAAATIGGTVACGLSGPRRMQAGAVRDFMLGAALMVSSGELLYFGGQVMKNVAGYDVSRLLCGSMGVLGLVTEVSLKVLPVPAAEQTLRMAMPAASVLDTLNRWAGRPLPVSATAWVDDQLTLRLSGAVAAVSAAQKQFIDESGAVLLDAATAAAFWTDVREQQLPFFGGDEPLWRLSVPTAAPALPLAGRQLIEWGGGLRWYKGAADPQAVRAAAARAGGSAVLFRATDKTGGVLPPLADALLQIHKRLKREFDPHGIFNVGRLYPDL